jgi:hypothetical protein
MAGGEESGIAAAMVKRHATPQELVELLMPAATVSLSASERDRLRAVMRRADKLAHAAVTHKVAIMVDAEQSYLQPAIDFVTSEMQRRYNRHDPTRWSQPEVQHVLRAYVRQQEAACISEENTRMTATLRAASNKLTLLPPPASPGQHDTTPYVYTTFQAYLVDSVPRLRLSLARSVREGWTHAAKLVRGAYMIQERERSVKLGYKDPIHST